MNFLDISVNFLDNTFLIIYYIKQKKRIYKKCLDFRGFRGGKGNFENNPFLIIVIYI